MRMFLSAVLASAALGASATATTFVPDIEYGQAGGQSLKLDISIPDGEGPFPVAILIHGGGWASGDKSGADRPNSGADISPWFEPLNEAGFLWFSINYRLAPENRWPACHEDTLAALRWINEHAADYQGDPQKVAVFGHSAGGQLAALTAMANPEIRPEVIVACAAVTDLELDSEVRNGLSTSLQDLFDQPKEVTPESLQILREASPIDRLEPNMPSFLFVHGDADKTVPIEQTVNLRKRLQVLGTPTDLLVIPGAGHRLTEWADHDPEWQNKMVHKLKTALNSETSEDSLFFEIKQNAISLLPSPSKLPFANGESDRLFTQAGANLQVHWENRQLTLAKVTSTRGEPIVLQSAGRSITLEGPVGTLWALDQNLEVKWEEKAFDAYVSADGSGQYTSIQRAIVKCPADPQARKDWIIQVAPGTYRERLYIQREKRFVTLRGYDPAKTVITFDLHARMQGPDGEELGTFLTPTVTIEADDFTVENLTIENAAGPVGQALAITINGDRSIFRNSRFLGWQDTILANRGRHYFENCYIAGSVDYIFGEATSYFENCHLHNRSDGYITAASTPPDSGYGFVFSNCRITGAEPDTKIYLGRPWRPYAAVTFLNTSMSENIRPDAWHNWGQPDREKTSRYFEFNSFGPGADPEQRVKWANKEASATQRNLTPSLVLAGSDNWDPVSN